VLPEFPKTQGGPVTDGFMQPRSCKLADNEEHREPVQDNARWVKAPAARPRLYNVSVRGFEIFDHINLLQVFIRS
jgi:hypothetical protein